jgi:predicted transcriptional regulator
LRGLVRQVFGGSPATALQHLLAEEGVSRQELDDIKEIIDRYETEHPKAKK